ncbi:MAG: hypothetical protein ABMA15_04965 [Vicinamibacterales bacterium]
MAAPGRSALPVLDFTFEAHCRIGITFVYNWIADLKPTSPLVK